MSYCFSLFLTLLTLTGYAHIPSLQDTLDYRRDLNQLATPQCISTPEGAFVYYFHPLVKDWLLEEINMQQLQEIRSKLSPQLKIPLSKEGFTLASPRRPEDEDDPTSYSAIWVRDCCWHYYGLKTYDTKAAKRLLMSLLHFYTSNEQIERFISVIKQPELADPSKHKQAHMNVPLIRFSKQTLSHYRVNDEDQIWPHIQFDSHGLFLLAIADALTSGLLTPKDLTPQDFEVFALFPALFTETEYWEKEDEGPWEEALLNNTSTTGIVAAGQKRMMDIIDQSPFLRQDLKQAIKRLDKKYGPVLAQKVESAASPKNIEALYQKGIKVVERNLSLGAESPDLSGKGVDRGADIALLFLCIPDHSLYYNHPEKMREILNITLSLVGPYGVYRYKYDPYQAMNYWIDYELSSPIFGKKTKEFQTLDRFRKGYLPNKQSEDAQWFFDSNFASVYYRLSLLMKDPVIQAYYIKKGDIHLKRALGQLTGINAHAANGEKLPPLQLPESINTVTDANYNYQAMASPICPLSWATAALLMALEDAEKAHTQHSRVKE